MCHHRPALILLEILLPQRSFSKSHDPGNTMACSVAIGQAGGIAGRGVCTDIEGVAVVVILVVALVVVLDVVVSLQWSFSKSENITKSC